MKDAKIEIRCSQRDRLRWLSCLTEHSTADGMDFTGISDLARFSLDLVSHLDREVLVALVSGAEYAGRTPGGHLNQVLLELMEGNDE